jgi:hypothetical protein
MTAEAKTPAGGLPNGYSIGFFMLLHNIVYIIWFRDDSFSLIIDMI